MTSFDLLFESFPSEDDMFNIIQASASIWGGKLTKSDIDKWLANFKGEVYSIAIERRLALWLLCNFTYYNESEVKHLCKILFNDFKHFIAKDGSDKGKGIDTALSDFFDASTIISAEVTSGSGGFIAYFFRQENNLPIEDGLFSFSIDNIGNSIKNVIVIDDVTLSEGTKSQKFAFWKGAIDKYPDKSFYILTLIASKASIEDLKAIGVNIISAITLDNRDKCFHNDSYAFSAFPTFNEVAKKFAAHYGEKAGPYPNYPLGYNNGEYIFGFFYNTPDNTLPIFWGQRAGWIPIIKRYHKNGFSHTYMQHGRFI